MREEIISNDTQLSQTKKILCDEANVGEVRHFNDEYIFFMKEAYAEATKAKAINEVPIGCVVVKEGVVIGRGYNQRTTKGNTLYHAELIAINEACNHSGDWRLSGCDIYVTVEPCAMCSGAILQARIDRLVFATRNPKAGCCGSIYNLLDDQRFNHQAEIIEGVMKDECAELMKDFFRQFRK